jgi:hypothetical protein
MPEQSTINAWVAGHDGSAQAKGVSLTVLRLSLHSEEPLRSTSLAVLLPGDLAEPAVPDGSALAKMCCPCSPHPPPLSSGPYGTKNRCYDQRGEALNKNPLCVIITNQEQVHTQGYIVCSEEFESLEGMTNPPHFFEDRTTSNMASGPREVQQTPGVLDAINIDHRLGRRLGQQCKCRYFIVKRP